MKQKTREKIAHFTIWMVCWMCAWSISGDVGDPVGLMGFITITDKIFTTALLLIVVYPTIGFLLYAIFWIYEIFFTTNNE
ncbi:MAG: hypothetical protein MR902_06995 [Campylobacter sp.]|nr:hypothetical protein [Campylobacter sp.]